MRTPLLKDVGTGDRTPSGLLVPSARAYRLAAWTSTAGGFTKIPIDTIAYDPAGLFNLATNRYIVPMAGIYRCSSHLEFAGASLTTVMAIYKNGASVADTSVGGGSAASESGGLVIDSIVCTAGDYLETYVWTGTNAVSFPSTQRGFAVEKVG